MKLNNAAGNYGNMQFWCLSQANLNLIADSVWFDFIIFVWWLWIVLDSIGFHRKYYGHGVEVSGSALNGSLSWNYKGLPG